MYVRIREGSKSRIQMFEGVVVAMQSGGVGETFTVRKMSNGVGVQRTFPKNSPIIDHIEVARKGKLGYLKGLSAKNSRIKEDR